MSGLSLDHAPAITSRWVAPLPASHTAIVDAHSGRTVDAEELRWLIAERVEQLELTRRSLVVLEGAASIEWIVTYLALLDAGHVPLLTPAHAEAQIARWQPAAAIHADRSGWTIARRECPPIDLHPDLALLLSTSGSTGSPRLVRLSQSNVLSNADAIAGFLGLTGADRAITSLPLHYCYGLSVLHSHLAAGASIVITNASVVDPCFLEAFDRHAVTNLAGVPHTFDLLDRAGPDRILTPHLRFVTAAGGRLAPATAAAWARRLASRGVDLYLMYGQTEATARIAYLPPDLVGEHPDSIGLPIPGGALEIDTDARPDGAPVDSGELVYRGPNVMLGYADTSLDLAGGRSVDELRTGDIARRDPASGLFQIVGRKSRFVKPFGLRIDLDRVETELRAAVPAVDLAIAGDDHQVRAVSVGADVEWVRRRLTTLTGLPAAALEVFDVAELPRTANGKVDAAAIMRWAAPRPLASSSALAERPAAGVLAEVLGRSEVADSDTFVSLGGDSLSYIECSLRLEAALGTLPADWHLRPVAELEPRPRQRHLRVDTTAVLRAVGIAAVVATHMRLAHVPGGAHLMLAVVGYNFARFVVPITGARDRRRAGLRTLGRVVAPTLGWIAAGMLIGRYGWPTLTLLNNYLGPAHHRSDAWHFWFIEALAQLSLAALVLLAVPSVRRLERRNGFGFALSLLVATLVIRLDWPGLDPTNLRFRTHGVAWCFALGWLVQRSDTTSRKVVASVATIVTVVSFFEYPPRQLFVIGGVLLMAWLPRLALPRALAHGLAALGSASLWILITHFSVWPSLVEWVGRPLAYPLTLAVGLAVARVASLAGAQLMRLRKGVA